MNWLKQKNAENKTPPVKASTEEKKPEEKKPKLKIVKPKKEVEAFELVLSPYAYNQLHWQAQRTNNELSSMGILEAESDKLIIREFILAEQEVSAASVDLDMDWLADEQMRLFDSRGIQPWQLSVWCHTHPAGVNSPSSVDEATMEESFGTWDFAVMLIMTKAGVFYARVDYTHRFTDKIAHRMQTQLPVTVDWGLIDGDSIDARTIARWEAEYKDRVSERYTYSGSWYKNNYGAYAEYGDLEDYEPVKPSDKKASSESKDLIDDAELVEAIETTGDRSHCVVEGPVTRQDFADWQAVEYDYFTDEKDGTLIWDSNMQDWIDKDTQERITDEVIGEIDYVYAIY